MPKISIADTVRFAYRFAFGQIGAIIGLVWLPLLIVAVLQFLPYAIGTAYPPNASDSAAAGGTLLNFVFSAGVLALYAMNGVSVTRQALGLRQGAASFHFALGLPEWRMFAAIIACGLLLVAAIGFYVLAGSFILPRVAGTAMLQLLADAYTAAGLCAIAWFALRLVFLVPPVVVAEGRLDLPHAWILTRRNFWRILAVALAVTIPLLVIQCVALAFIAGPAFFAPLPDNAASAAQALEQRFALFDRHMPSLIGLTLILTPFNLGLTLGAAAFSYRTLVPDRTPPRNA